MPSSNVQDPIDANFYNPFMHLRRLSSFFVKRYEWSLDQSIHRGGMNLVKVVQIELPLDHGMCNTMNIETTDYPSTMLKLSQDMQELEANGKVFIEASIVNHRSHQDNYESYCACRTRCPMDKISMQFVFEQVCKGNGLPMMWVIVKARQKTEVW